MIGHVKRAFLNLSHLSGIAARSSKSDGLMRIIRSIDSSFNLAAITAAATDFPVTMISVGSPMISLIKSVINCTYKKLL